MNPIHLTDVQKRFGDKAVLRGISFDVQPGETVGFVGPNGAGKTTCLRTLIGLLPRDAGKCKVLGMDPQRDAIRIRSFSTYLPGETSIYLGMRGRDFLRFALSFYPNHQEDIRLDLLERFELPLQKKVRSYSAGMKQKLALMATLIPDVALYILDEPDRALDATTRFFLRDVLNKLRDKNKAILLSSHHLREIEALADRLVFVMDGRIIRDDRVRTAREILARRVRLRVTEGTPLPGGAVELGRDMDGTLTMQPEGDPLDWLAHVPTANVLAAEVGTVRLEDLYHVLIEEGAA